MRTLLLLACAIYTFMAHAQISCIGKSENAVKIYLSTSNFTFQDSTISTKGNDRVVSIEYTPNDNAPNGDIPIGFTFKNDICVSFFLHSYLKDLPPLISWLNQNYIRIDDNNWIDKKKEYQAELKSNETGFYMFFKRM